MVPWSILLFTDLSTLQWEWREWNVPWTTSLPRFCEQKTSHILWERRKWNLHHSYCIRRQWLSSHPSLLLSIYGSIDFSTLNLLALMGKNDNFQLRGVIFVSINFSHSSVTPEINVSWCILSLYFATVTVTWCAIGFGCQIALRPQPSQIWCWINANDSGCTYWDVGACNYYSCGWLSETSWVSADVFLDD